MSDIIIYILLGIIQGFTEPLPISSSGHLEIAQHLLDIEKLDVSFSAFVNFGSTVAIIIYFREKIKDLIIAFIYLIGTLAQKKKIRKYRTDIEFIFKIIIATLPLVVAGVGLKVLEILVGFELGAGSIKYVGFALLITAALLLVVKNKDGSTSIKEMTYTQALIIGIAQAISLVPGISRSGMTLVAALYLGISKKDAFNFSFIMFIPASIGALIFGLVDMVGLSFADTMLYMVSLILAGAFTWISLLLTRRIVISQKLVYFSIYCFCLGLGVILFLG